MHFYLYQITNNVNGKIYAGVHKTTDLDDGYMGSGKILKAAIKKYGIENFTKEILIFFDNSADMFAAEKELVTDEFLLREDTYNLRRGGTGGFDYINANGLQHKRLFTSADHAKKVQACKDKPHEEWSIVHKARYAAIDKQTRLEWNQAGRLAAQSTESNEKRRASKKGTGTGAGNSQAGTMWITDGAANRKVRKNENLPDGWYKGRKTK